MSNEAYLVPNPIAPCLPIRIDPELCVSCYRCADQCRTDIMVKNAPKECGIAACEESCPAGEAIRWTTWYIAKGEFDKALESIKIENPFPGVCGRVCFHPCEDNCARITLDEGIGTNALERAAYDYGSQKAHKPRKLTNTGKKVAVVGGGPAGLSCAYYLSLLGHEVTVFEAKPVAGGIPRLNIPEFRLPAAIVDNEIDLIRDLGVEIKVNSPVDAKAFDKLTDDYDACFVATGAPLSSKLNVSGENNPNVIGALEFLYSSRIDNNTKIGEKVVVIGGGNVATDSARLARRLGAKEVVMICLESRDTMPAYATEIEAAENEGIKILPSWGVNEIKTEGDKITGIALKACTSTVDVNGNFSPCYDDSETREETADTIVLAIGQRTDLSFADPRILTGPRITLNPRTLETPLPGVFAGGDVGSANRSIVQAIASGKRAAISIDIYLKNGDKKILSEIETEATSMLSYIETGNPVPANRVPEEIVSAYYGPGDRKEPETLPENQRITSMDEVNKGLIQEKAVAEAIRCFRCHQYEPPLILYSDECWFCGTCVEECPVEGAIKMEHPLNQRVIWKRKETGELFRRGMKNPPPPTKREPSGMKNFKEMR